jgi:hypothetical protein
MRKGFQKGIDPALKMLLLGRRSSVETENSDLDF